jgi:hypothetical protein
MRQMGRERGESRLSSGPCGEERGNGPKEGESCSVELGMGRHDEFQSMMKFPFLFLFLISFPFSDFLLTFKLGSKFQISNRMYEEEKNSI